MSYDRQVPDDELVIEHEGVRFDIRYDRPVIDDPEAVLDAPLENPSEEIPVGAIAYWPTGSKLCLFWGPTPASTGDEPRATAPVNVVVRLEDISALSDLEGGARVRFDAEN